MTTTEPPSPLRVRTLGRSTVPVTALGFGGASIAGLYEPVDADTAAATVEAAWRQGVRFYDTAPHYGVGLSERRLGEALRAKPRADYTLSTKVGRLLVPPGGDGDDLRHGFASPGTYTRRWDFSADGVRRSIEESLERLGLDRIDVALIHDPDRHEEAAFREAYPALERLRAEGVVGAIGAGMNQAEMLARFMKDTDVDAVLCAGRYTLLEQPALAELLPAAAARGKSVIIGGVFNSGLLADPAAPGATYNYAPVSDELRQRARRMEEITKSYGVQLRTAALNFPFGHPAVATVLAGARSTAEATDAAAAMRHPIPGQLWRQLREEGLLGADVPVPGEY